MNRWRVGEDIGSKETDGCLLTGGGMHWKHWNALEALECIGSIGMHWKHWYALEALECIGRAQRQTELMELTDPAVNTKCRRQSKQSELVRTH
jgi:hypothetical protein